MMVYKGEATDMADMTEEAGKAVLAAWNGWIAKTGAALVHVGSPFGPGVSVVDDGKVGSPMAATGYSIVDAQDLDSAKDLADGHPYLSEGKGNFAIDIYELTPAPF